MRSVSTRFTGLLLVALGVWGGLVPFVGHYFHFALGPDKSWDWTANRLYLDVLPGAATILGGLNLISAGPRRSARLGALLALAGGVWFAIGPEISQLWTAGGAQGAGHGSAHIQMLEMLTYHTGLGVLVTALAAHALPRFPVVEEAVAPGRRRIATAGAAGAGAGTVASERGDRWYHEPGALEDPRDRAVQDGELEPQAGDTRQHSGAGEAGVGGAGVGGAGVGAGVASHRERVAEEERGRDGLAGDEGGPGGRDALAADEPGREPATASQAADGVEPGTANQAGDGVQPGTAAAGAGASGDAGATSATTAYPGHEPAVRRRRGGLLSGLLRR